jgi:hypothetical protein
MGNGNPGGLQPIQGFSLAVGGDVDFDVDVATQKSGVLGDGGALVQQANAVAEPPVWSLLMLGGPVAAGPRLRRRRRAATAA